MAPGSPPRDQPYSIDNTETDECPVSLITPQSFVLIQEIVGSQYVKEATGATLYGPDSGDWPATFYDAIRLCEVERIRTENAEREARDRY